MNEIKTGLEPIIATLREVREELEIANDRAEQQKKLDHMLALADAHGKSLIEWRKWKDGQEAARWDDDRR
jgi:hypothetical protein